MPRELGLDESTGGEGLAGLDDLEVVNVELEVLLVVVLLGYEDALYRFRRRDI